MLRVRLLGPIAAYCPDGSIPLGGSKPRAILAALVLEQGRVVPVSRLVDVVWPDDPPASARALVQTYVSSLRKAFARHGFPHVIDRHPPGYRIRLDKAMVDADVFTELVNEGQELARAGDCDQAADLFHKAISLCHGPALSGLDSAPLAAAARRLDELLLIAHSERFEVELSLGRCDHLAELSSLVARHAANERLRGQLMLTLYRLGRQADALACYREGRTALVDELGVEPGRQLQMLHNAILAGDSGLLEKSAHHGARRSTSVIPAQIPPATADFTGRGRERGGLVAALRGGSPGTHVVAGPGGSGKSTLGVWVAQQVADSFPDGQLYADLGGMSDTPATPGEVLAGFLRSLGIDDAYLPESTRERTELFRSLLAGRRTLLLFDDAAGERQLRPLLPGGPGCAVLVTSRGRLAGLAGATLTELDVFTDEEARELLGRIVGDERMADAAAAARLLTACENLPLAIRVAGARLATRRNLPLAVLAERLTDDRKRLDELSAGDLAVRSSIGLSYRRLTEPGKAALRRIGFFGIPEFNAWVVGWLLAVDHAAAEALLELLVDAQLVSFTGVDSTGVLCYRLHALVRIYARERADAEESPDALREAVGRVLTGWRALIDRIAVDAPPAEVVWRRPPPVEFEIPDSLTRRVLADPTGWLHRQELVLTVGVERAGAIGLHQVVGDFVSALTAQELKGANRFEFQSRVVAAALPAAARAGEPYDEALMLFELARLRMSEDRHGEARQHFGEALSTFRTLHDVRGQAAALAGLGIACRDSGHLTEALHFLDQAAALLQALDDAGGIGYVHRVRGSVRLEQGAYPAALVDLELSLRAYERAGSRRGVAYTVRSIGIYHRVCGKYAESLRACERAAEIFDEAGDQLMRSYAVRSHATARLRMGSPDRVCVDLERALSVAKESEDRWGQAMALHVLGQFHRVAGWSDGAEICLDEAMSLWEVMRSSLWRARTEHVLSLVYRDRGDVAAADTAYARACRVFREHNSREHVELQASAAVAGAATVL
ncbi:AfsR/SARP family transcriptional regulator [Micromonospora rifamycinica]|uniref:DNA-binding transcriptional activator of the SARP family n=1 Tax=Micromonospora rifamycinica TaxID=291594 RepID=A0A1C5KFP1_9ACTN|nr:AfsR/SARP family transcriptional regulator [Micromonospora rifamycinica]SCG81605.1 DNA-binding transcriptional activator of the SARP family [Micromonospora rifamycinica]